MLPDSYVDWNLIGQRMSMDASEIQFLHCRIAVKRNHFDSFLASNSALVLGELSATVKLFFFSYYDDVAHIFPAGHERLRTPLQIPPMTLKKYASGKGTSKKQEMLLFGEVLRKM